MLKSTKKFSWLLLFVIPLLLSACNSVPNVDWTLKLAEKSRIPDPLLCRPGSYGFCELMTS